MAQELTVGVLHDIFAAEHPLNKEQFPMPILQVLQIKLLTAQPNAPERYRIVFSDSQNFVQSIVASRMYFCVYLKPSRVLKPTM